MREHIAGVKVQAERWRPEEILRWAFATFKDDVAMASGGGVEGMVLLDIAARVNPKLKVFTLDTEFLFPETYDLIDRVEKRYGIKVERVYSALTPEEQGRAYGSELWDRNPDQCCNLRKVEPLRRKLSQLRGWITAIRRDQTAARANTHKVEWDEKFQLVKVNPIADWNTRMVWDYVYKHDVPYNPLHDQNYPSIGCTHCTRAVEPGEDARAGRWPGFQKTECGLHLGSPQVAPAPLVRIAAAVGCEDYNSAAVFAHAGRLSAPRMAAETAALRYNLALHMDFDQLVTFLEVAKLGSFSRAGQKVFRSQSAVSAQIRQLEQEYGDRLLDRSGKDVTLTPAGRVLFAYAERLLQMKDESLLAVADQGNVPRGTISVGANEATCLYVLPDVFAKFSSLYPGVQISIYRNFSYKIVEKLEMGTIDVGIVTLPVKSSSLKTHAIFRDQLMLMVNPQNPLAKLDVVPVSEIAKQPLLLPKTGYSRRIMDKLFRPYSAHLQVRMELPSIGMIKSFVAAGLGVSLISASFARDQVLAGRVKLIPVQDKELWRELGIAYRRDRTLTRATSTFISTVRQLASASK